MIRFFLLTLVPLIVPFVVWYLWQVFSGRPRVDPSTGDQEAPNLGAAPFEKLLIGGVLLMILTLGIFLFVHDEFTRTPYKAIDLDKFEENQKRE